MALEVQALGLLSSGFKASRFTSRSQAASKVSTSLGPPLPCTAMSTRFCKTGFYVQFWDGGFGCGFRVHGSSLKG